MISDWDREHMGDILVGHGDWFTAQLLRLCAKADAHNLERIRKGYGSGSSPELSIAFATYCGGLK